MSVSRTLRNRIVGGLIIFSLLLLILPALIDRRDTAVSSSGSSGSDNLIAIDENGALQDDQGRLLINSEPDYATLLAPVDDMPKSTAVQTGSSSSAQKTESSSGTELLTDRNTAAAPVIVETPLPAPAATPAPASAPAPAATEILTAKNPPAVSPSPAPAPAARPVSSNTPKAAAGSTPSGAYTIQVGAFSKADNAETMVRKLNAGNIQAYTENITVNGTQMIRVYAGSASSQQALEPLLKSVEQLTGAKGRIVRTGR